MPQGPLRGICRHCGEKVKYHLLPRPTDKPGGTYYTWFHMEDPPGDQLYCKLDSQPERMVRKRAEPREYCAEHTNSATYSYAGNICNRPVKDHDLFMCGIHARQVHNERERRKQFSQEREISGYIFTETVDLQQRLKERYGIDTKTHYDFHNHRYSGMVLINPAELLSFLEEIFDA